MAFTLLQLVDQVAGELGLTQSTVVIGSSNGQTVQFLALAQRLLKDLVREYEWQRLVKAYVFQTTTALTKTGNTTSASAVVSGMSNTTSLAAGDVITGTGIGSYAEILTVDSSTQITMTIPATAAGTGTTLTFAKQDYAVPSGYDRMVSDTNWDRTNHWRNLGAKTSQDWQWFQGGVVSVGPRERFRIYNNNLRIFPAVTTVYNIAYEYVSNFSVIATGGTAGTKATFTVDTDTCVFQDDLMAAGLKMYFLKAKKLDYGAELEEFSRTLSACKAQDVPAPSLSLAPQPAELLVGPNSIPDGSWPTS